MECGVSPEGAPSPLWIAFPRLPGWDRGPSVFNPKRCRRPDESAILQGLFIGLGAGSGRVTGNESPT